MNKHDRVVLVTGIIVVAAMLLSAFALGSNESASGAVDNIANRWFDKMETKIESFSSSSLMTGAGQTDSHEIDGSERAIKNITATVTWQDEADIQRVRMYQNQPDQFSVEIFNTTGASVASATGRNDRAANGGTGEITAEVSLDEEELDRLMDSGNWMVEVTLDSIGDYEARLGIGLWPITPEDTGNEYEIKIDVEYYDLAEES
ncbi:MAG: hypothetical protein ACMUIG_05725 [Thermoplasmatota archaeon]